jgi:hypothetical protein
VRPLIALAIVTLAPGLGTACFESSVITTTSTAHDLVIQALLDAGSRDQYVIVQTIGASIADQIPVAGATVTLMLPNGTSVTAIEELNTGVATPEPGEPAISRVYHFPLGGMGIPLVPGGTYRLRVVVPDGRVATGRTTIPNAAPATIAGDTVAFDRKRDTLRTSIARVPGATGYEVDIVGPGAQGRVFTTLSDTAVSLPGTMDAFASVPSAPAIVVISALDSAYYAYYRRAGDPVSGIAVAGNLTGALGVFGSIVDVKRLTLLVH